MNRPDPKSYKFSNNPKQAYGDAMRNYLVYLEENQADDDLVANYAVARKLSINAEMENYELRKTLKILRSQIKTMFKENDGTVDKN